ncbi:MAG TPA: FHA domain-containing protein [Polyangiaceae bacterium]|nr:FHA domain-containing protein [Polyangiaceae bacterium]
MKETAVDNLWPREIAARARAASEVVFVKEMDGWMLLVRVEDAAGETAQVLQRGALGERTPLTPSISFRTTMRVGNEPPVRPPVPFGPKQLELRLLAGPFVAVPIHKRAGSGKEFIERVSVGRAINNDIVIRDDSVSKVHAWFARGEEGNIYIADAGSRNKTLLNGVALPLQSPEETTGGDAIRFGAVEALLCSAKVYWQAVHG